MELKERRACQVYAVSQERSARLCACVTLRWRLQRRRFRRDRYPHVIRWRGGSRAARASRPNHRRRAPGRGSQSRGRYSAAVARWSPSRWRRRWRPPTWRSQRRPFRRRRRRPPLRRRRHWRCPRTNRATTTTSTAATSTLTRTACSPSPSKPRSRWTTTPSSSWTSTRRPRTSSASTGSCRSGATPTSPATRGPTSQSS